MRTKKKLFLCLIALICATATAWADDPFTVDGISYAISSGNYVTVEGYETSSTATTLSIPYQVTYPSIGGTTYTVTAIAASAFVANGYLQTVSIPNSVTSIGKAAFGLCTSLETVTVTASSGDALTLTIGESAFASCHNLTSFAPTATSVGKRAFQTCESLQTIDLSKATAISDYAFDGCTALASSEANSSTTSAKGMYSVVTTEDEDNGNSSQGGETSGTVDLSAITSSIGAYAFRGCTAITGVTLPSSDITLGDYAFNGCTELATIDLAHLTSIGNYAFYGCTKIATADLSAATTIGAYAFGACTALATATLNTSSTVTLNPGAFYHCSQLSTIDLTKVDSIPDHCFYGCTTLPSTGFDLKSVQTIGAFAFAYCSFSSITIPTSVKKIKTEAFANCSSLASITVSWSTSSDIAECADDAFKGIASTASLTTGSLSAENYSTGGWAHLDARPSTISIKITSAKYATFYSPYEYTISGDSSTNFRAGVVRVEEGGAFYINWMFGPSGQTYTKYYLKETNEFDEALGEEVTTTQVADSTNVWCSQTVPAGTAVIVKYTGEDTIDATDGRTFTFNTSSDYADAVEANYLVGDTTGCTTYAYTSDYTKTTANYYFYGLSNETGRGIGFYPRAAACAAFNNTTTSPWAWLAVPASIFASSSSNSGDDTDTKAMQGFSIDDGEGDSTTGIDAAPAQTAAAPQGIYTLQGVRVNNMNQKGIYIVNGRKVVKN